MKLRGVMSIVALGCMMASAPVACLKYPWLPATIGEFSDLQHDPAPWGTESYHQGRAQRLARVETALLLYALGTAALCGLGAIVVKVLPRWAELAVWIVTAAAAVGIARFDRAGVGPSTASSYSWMTIYMPLGVAGIATLAAFLRLLSLRSDDKA